MDPAMTAADSPQMPEREALEGVARRMMALAREILAASEAVANATGPAELIAAWHLYRDAIAQEAALIRFLDIAAVGLVRGPEGGRA